MSGSSASPKPASPRPCPPTTALPSLLSRLGAGVAALVVLLCLSSGCGGSTAPYVWFSDVPESPADAERARRIEDGDRIRIVIHEHPEMSGEHVVSTDGTYVQPLAGPIVVGGLELDKAAQRIAQKLTPYLKKPVVSVTLLELHTIKVNAIGEVNNTGIYELEHNEGVMSLLTLAGGLTEFADRDAIYVLRDGDPPLRIRFRYKDLVQPKPKAISFVLRDGDTVLVE